MAKTGSRETAGRDIEKTSVLSRLKQVSAAYPEDASRRSEVKVILRNVGEGPVDLKNGTLRVVVTRWAD